jgi:hypothetical protein
MGSRNWSGLAVTIRDADHVKAHTNSGDPSYDGDDYDVNPPPEDITAVNLRSNAREPFV